MTHFVILIIIPRRVYLQGETAIKEYISQILIPYDENLEVEAYIEKTKRELEEEFEHFKNSDQFKEYNYSNVEEYANNYLGLKLNEDGNIISTYNENALFDWYEIGGRWDGILTNNRQYSNQGFNWHNKHNTVANNCITVKKLIENYANNTEIRYIYSDIINTQGKLIQYKQLLEEEKDKDNYVVNLDCHI